jgi:vitamin B12/bleomycin/antimicrobial peptide transport system ATP-binding/permease protein
MRPNDEVAAGGSSAFDATSAGVTSPEAMPSVPDSSTDATVEPTTLSMKSGTRRFLIRRFWATAAGFWGRPGSRAACTLSAAILVIILFNLGMLYAINLWNRKIFDGLQSRDSSAVLFLSLIYFPILFASVASNIIQVYVRMTLQRRWRAWLNDRLIDRWLANGRYYLLNLVSGDHKNPEFRIAEDVRVATDSPVDFATGVASAFLSAATFVFAPSARCCAHGATCAFST